MHERLLPFRSTSPSLPISLEKKETPCYAMQLSRSIPLN